MSRQSAFPVYTPQDRLVAQWNYDMWQTREKRLAGKITERDFKDVCLTDQKEQNIVSLSQSKLPSYAGWSISPGAPDDASESVDVDSLYAARYNRTTRSGSGLSVRSCSQPGKHAMKEPSRSQQERAIADGRYDDDVGRKHKHGSIRRSMSCGSVRSSNPSNRHDHKQLLLAASPKEQSRLDAGKDDQNVRKHAKSSLSASYRLIAPYGHYDGRYDDDAGRKHKHGNSRRSMSCGNFSLSNRQDARKEFDIGGMLNKNNSHNNSRASECSMNCSNGKVHKAGRRRRRKKNSGGSSSMTGSGSTSSSTACTRSTVRSRSVCLTGSDGQ